PGGPGSRPRVGVLVHAHHLVRRPPVRVDRSAHLVRKGDGMSGAAIPVVLRVPREDRIGAIAYFARRNPRMIVGGALVVMGLFPALVLAIAITSALGPQIQNAMIAIGIVAIPAYARLTRGQVLAVRAREFIVAARTIGCSPLRIVLRHIFPNVTNALVVQATLATAFAILAEAALSF